MVNIKLAKKLSLLISIAIISSCGWFSDHEEPEENTGEVVSNNFYKRANSQIPYYGPITKTGNDTLFYQIPKFYLTGEDGNGLGYSYFEGSILVVDFFFTTCSTICPLMTDEMAKLQGQLQADSLMGKVKFLSVTIDPETDSPEVLKAYAEKNKADLANWRFGTRDIEYIDELSKDGFFLAVDRDVVHQDGIIHSSQLILVDENRHVRGSYDGIDEAEMQRLLADIKILENE